MKDIFIFLILCGMAVAGFAAIGSTIRAFYMLTTGTL